MKGEPSGGSRAVYQVKHSGLSSSAATVGQLRTQHYSGSLLAYLFKTWKDVETKIFPVRFGAKQAQAAKLVTKRPKEANGLIQPVPEKNRDRWPYFMTALIQMTVVEYCNLIPCC